jgi:dihydroneopterin aldolase
MKGIMGFDDLKIHCIVGIYPEERIHKQDVFIDLRVQLDLGNSIQSQSIDPAIDYTKLARISLRSGENQYFLIEAFANDILESIFKEFDIVNWAWIKIKKPQAIQEARYAYVELEKGIRE